jgi:hypothetical protein
VYTQDSTPQNAQYEYVDDDIHQAIISISGESPNVTVLVNECFEVSLLFFEHKFGLGNAQDFLQSTNVHSNGSTRRNDTTDLVTLRKLSKRYFSKEYKFYYAAVRQFKKQVMAINASFLDGCNI